MKTRLLFMASNPIAIPLLEAFIKEADFDLVGVVTSTDKPIGRGQKVEFSLVKQYLINSNFNQIHQPVTPIDLEKIVELTNPEIIVVFAYGMFLTKKILKFPKYGCLNLHASLLPKFRGAIPIQKAILERETVTGISLQKMTNRMDAGRLLGTRKINIDEIDNSTILIEKISKIAKEMISDINLWVEGKIKPLKQDESMASYCFEDELKKNNAQLKFEDDIVNLTFRIRAYNPFPVAWIYIPNGKFKEKRLKIFSAKIFNNLKNSTFNLYKDDLGNLMLTFANGTLLLNEIQLEGKKVDVAKNYKYLL